MFKFISGFITFPAVAVLLILGRGIVRVLKASERERKLTDDSLATERYFSLDTEPLTLLDGTNDD